MQVGDKVVIRDIDTTAGLAGRTGEIYLVHRPGQYEVTYDEMDYVFGEPNPSDVFDEFELELIESFDHESNELEVTD